MMEAQYTTGSDDEDSGGAGLISSLEATAMTQLPNRWSVRPGLSGQCVTDKSLGAGQDGKFSDDVFLSVSGIWGELLLGNVSDTVRDQTRRQQGFGNASLTFDDFHGEPTERSAGHVGRFGPQVASGVVDDDSNIELGLSFQRPIGNGNQESRRRPPQRCSAWKKGLPPCPGFIRPPGKTGTIHISLIWQTTPTAPAVARMMRGGCRLIASPGLKPEPPSGSWRGRSVD